MTLRCDVKELKLRAKLKLAESAIDDAAAKKLGLDVLAADGILELHPSLERRGGIHIPYFTAAGEKRRDVFRVRYLEDPLGFPQKKVAKYGQPTGSPVAAYFAPRALTRAGDLPDWKELLLDPARPLFITEGEFKAACGVIHGIPMIGLGGVYSFQSARRGLDFLPELEDVAWRGREVFVVYDSDIISKAEVQTALTALCAKLTERGAVPKIIRLPSDVYGESPKGVDDFIVARGRDAFDALVESAEPFGPARQLYELNERFAYCQSLARAVDFRPVKKEKNRRSHVVVGTFEMLNGLYLPGWLPGPRGGKKHLTAEWLTWPHRREIDRFTYVPGGERFIDSELNIWSGWGCDPKRGDVKPFLRLIEHLIPQKDRRRWFLAWLAWPLREPGTKLYSAAVLWGKPGTGKSLIGYAMKRIYGDNFVEVSSEQLGSKFNDWASGRQFAMVDEANTSSLSVRELSGELKRLITQEIITVNEKYIQPYRLNDHINYYFTSNQPHCLNLDTGDRRYFVHRVDADPFPREQYEILDRWLQAGGPSALFHWLLHECDVEDFNPREHALATDDKAEMVNLSSATDAHIFVRELMNGERPENYGDIFSIADLQKLQESRHPTQRPDSSRSFALALANAGAVHCPGHVVYVHELKRTFALYALYNMDKWRHTAAARWSRHYAEVLARLGRIPAAVEPENF